MSFNLQFANLEPHVQDKFIAVASKDPEGRTAAEWFEHLVPDSLQDSSMETEVFMDGGTVTQEVFVYDQGRGSGHWETVEHTIGDRDISRLEAGVNGGEYTHENTIMEDASINRSRGGEDMTELEFDAATEANSVDAELIDGANSAVDTLADATPETAIDALSEVSTNSSDLMATASESLADIIAPAIGAYIAGKAVADQFDDPKDKLGWGALASGGGALLCLTPVGQFGLACYGIYSIGKLGWKITQWTTSHA